MKLIVIATSALVLLTGCSASDSSRPQANTTGVTPPEQATFLHPPPLHSSAASDLASDGLLGGLDQTAERGERSPALSAGDGVHDAGGLPTQTIPSGTDARHIAARVALSAYIDPEWVRTLTSDLHPAYAELTEAARPSAPTSRQFGPLQLITVDVSVDDPNTMFVTFDEITDIQSIRHITIVTFDNAASSRPLVIDLEPIA